MRLVVPSWRDRSSVRRSDKRVLFAHLDAVQMRSCAYRKDQVVVHSPDFAAT